MYPIIRIIKQNLRIILGDSEPYIDALESRLVRIKITTQIASDVKKKGYLFDQFILFTVNMKFSHRRVEYSSKL